MGSLKRIGYYSLAVQPFAADDLLQLAVEAARFNALDGINGILFYGDGHFAQIFEGVDDGVNDLLSRLSRDPRHTDFQIIFEEKIEAPLFHSWDMHLCKETGEMNTPSITRMVGKPLPPHVADFIDNFPAQMAL